MNDIFILLSMQATRNLLSCITQLLFAQANIKRTFPFNTINAENLRCSLLLGQGYYISPGSSYVNAREVSNQYLGCHCHVNLAQKKFGLKAACEDLDKEHFDDETALPRAAPRVSWLCQAQGFCVTSRREKNNLETMKLSITMTYGIRARSKLVIILRIYYIVHDMKQF